MNVSQLHPYMGQLSLHCLQQVFTGIFQVPGHMALERAPDGKGALSPLLLSKAILFPHTKTTACSSALLNLLRQVSPGISRHLRSSSLSCTLLGKP